MGFFDYIGDKLQQINESSENTRKEIEDLDAITISSRLKTTSSIVKCGVYVEVLKEKFSEMDNSELIDLCENFRRNKNLKAATAIMPIMIERGLAHQDSNGNYVFDYNKY